MKIITIISILICLIACKKDEEVTQTVTNINVINAAVEIAAIKVNFLGNPISYAKTIDQVLYGTNKLYYSPSGVIPIAAVSSADTTKILFNKRVKLSSGFYTLYIAGQTPNIDTLFREEINFPYIKTDISRPISADSIVNIRFVNLSPNSPPLKINIKNSLNNEEDNFAYKSIGSWKKFSAKLATTPYIFEVRNTTTNNVLASYTFNATATNRFKNISLVVKGLVGTTIGVNAFGIFQVNYF